MDNRNIDITNIMNEVLNNLKGFDAATTNPREGIILVRYNGTTFYVTIEPMFNDNEKGKEADNKPFEEIVRSHSFIWDGELKSKENKIIDNRNNGDILNEHDKQLAILNKRLKKIEKIYKKHKKESVNDKSIKTPDDILYCPYCGHESLVPVYNGYSCVKCKSYFVIEHDII